MKGWIPLALVVVLVALLAWLGLRPRPAQAPVDARAPVASDSGARTERSALAEADTAATAPSRAAVPAPEVEGLRAPSPVASAPDETAKIRGRFVFADGGPAAGVRLSLSGSLVSTSRSDAALAPEPFERTAAESDANGRFEVRIDVVSNFRYQLEGMLRGFGLVCWTWYAIEPRKEIDVGDIQLVRAGSVRGRILDAGGRVLVKNWSVSAVMSSPDGQNRSSASFTGQPSLPGGEFLIENVPPGNVRLSTSSKLKTYAPDATVVQVRAGEETRADLHYVGPSLETRIVANALARPLKAFDGDVAQIVVRDPDGTERVANKMQGSTTRFAVDGLAPGSHTVELRDPRYLPWSQSDVQPGTAVDVPLIGNASVVLRVVDDATNAPIARYALDVRLEKLKALYKTFRILDVRRDPPADGVFGEVMPVEQTWIVQADGFARLEIPLQDLAPNEKRPLEARLVRGTELRGSVVSSATKTPLSGATVRIAPVRSRPESKMPAYLQFDADVVATVTTDAQGRFTIPGLGVGKYKLKAKFGGSAEVEHDVEVVRDAQPAELEIVVPSTGRLIGTILAPPGTSFAGLSVSVLPRSPPAEAEPRDPFLAVPEQRAVVNEAGLFTSSWIAAGEASAIVAGAETRIPTGPMYWQMIRGGTIDLGVVTLAPDVDTHHTFDLRETFPQTVTARVNRNGAPILSAVVTLYDPAKQKSDWAGITDANGVARIPRVPAGTYWVWTRDANSTWTFPNASKETRVELGRETQLDVDVALVSGELVLGSGTPPLPLAEAKVTFEPEGYPAASRANAVTDATGHVRVELTPGRWTVRHERRIDNAQTVVATALVEWTTSGPVLPVLALLEAPR